MIQAKRTDAFECCGVRIDAVPFDDAVEMILDRSAPGGRAVHLCNAYTLSLASKDRSFAALLNRGDCNVPDGMPLVWVARRLGFDAMTQRVYGPDLMAATLDRGRATGLRHFLLGATAGLLTKLRASIDASWPGAAVVGAFAPPFGDFRGYDERRMLETVDAASPDVVWVGLGTPKQDYFVDHYRDLLPATLVPVGAAFDFHARNKAQAPEWMRDRGLEWVFRLGTEPRRLWRRYLFGNTRFVATALSRRGWPRVLDADSLER